MERERMKILDIGCGREKYPDAIGIDKTNLPGVDVVIDFEKKKLPVFWRDLM
jgi:uncharacterized protein YcsI (UPF0317 family)